MEGMHWRIDMTLKKDANTTLGKISTELEYHSEVESEHVETDRDTRDKMSLRRKCFNISFASAQFIEELMKI